MHTKHATPDHPVHEWITQRWSPYAFADRSVSDDDLRSLFEAARWAASSYNEQPWRFLVARREDSEAHAKMLGLLVEANQAWAAAAPVLAIGVIETRFSRNGKPNKAAPHDLGLAAGSLSFEATKRGIAVHQMIGIEAEGIRDAYGLPESAEAFTALAIGYAAPAEEAPEALRGRDEAPRARKTLSEFVFEGRFGSAASWL